VHLSYSNVNIPGVEKEIHVWLILPGTLKYNEDEQNMSCMNMAFG